MTVFLHLLVMDEHGSNLKVEIHRTRQELKDITERRKAAVCGIPSLEPQSSVLCSGAIEATVPTERQSTPITNRHGAGAAVTASAAQQR